MLDNNTRYVYEVYRLKSVSAAANALFVSQPAISAAIRKVEKELGAPVFNRSTLPFTLTSAGKIYIEAVEKQLEIESQTINRIQNAAQSAGRTLRIASAAQLSFRIIPMLLRIFHQQFPQIHVQVRVTAAEKLNDMLTKNLADIVCSDFLLSTNYACKTLFMQRCVIVLAEDTPIDPRLRQYALSREALLRRDYPETMLVNDMTLFEDVEFLPIPPYPYINRRRTLLLGKYKTASAITSGTERMGMNYNLMLAGFGALLTTDAHIATLPADSRCMHFALGGPNAIQPFNLFFNQTAQNASSTVLDDFIRTAEEFFAVGNPLQKIVES